MMKQYVIASIFTVIGSVAAANTACVVMGPDANGEFTQVIAQKEFDLNATDASEIHDFNGTKVFVAKNEDGGLTIVSMDQDLKNWNSIVASEGKTVLFGSKVLNALIVCQKQ